MSVSFLYCHLLSSFLFHNSISLQSYLTNRSWCTGQLHSGPHQKPINHIYHTQLPFLPSLLLFWTSLTTEHAVTPENLAVSSSARHHTCKHDLHYRWAARSNLFVLRWLQFLCHRTLGLQINIPGLSGSQVCFATGDRHTGIMADAWREFFKNRSTSSL